jgi:hypothetical protein
MFVFIYPSVRELLAIVLYSKSYRPLTFNIPFSRALAPYIAKLGPPGFRRFLVRLIPFKNIQKLCQIVSIMDRTSVAILEAKKAAVRRGDETVLRQIGRGKDIMSILCTQSSFAAHLTDNNPHVSQ